MFLWSMCYVDGTPSTERYSCLHKKLTSVEYENSITLYFFGRTNCFQYWSDKQNFELIFLQNLGSFLKISLSGQSCFWGSFEEGHFMFKFHRRTEHNTRYGDTKMCVWNKAFQSGLTPCLSIQRHYLYERKSKFTMVLSREIYEKANNE